MAKSKKLTTNEIVAFYSRMKKQPKLTIQKLNKSKILIEGSAKALEFLGKVVLAHSQADADDCGNGLGPRAAGSSWFRKDSTLGFYLHRLPCRKGSLAKKRAPKKHKSHSPASQDGQGPKNTTSN